MNIRDKFMALVGSIVAARMLFFGLTYAIGQNEAIHTLLWHYVDTFPHVSPETFGGLLIISAIMLIIGYIFKMKWLVKYGSQFQVLVLLFSTFIYIFNHAFLTALSGPVPYIALTFLSAYLYCRNSDNSVQELREFFGLDTQ